MWILALNPLFILVLTSFVHPRPENLLMCPLQAKLNALMVDAGHMLKTCKQMGAKAGHHLTLGVCNAHT